MKKYVSFFVLFALCVVCAWVFCIQASDLFPQTATDPTESTVSTGDKPQGTDATDTGTNVPPTEPTGTEAPQQTDAEPVRTMELTGTVTGEKLTDAVLRMEWAVCKKSGDPTVYVSVELYLDCENTVIRNAHDGVLQVGEKTVPFSFVNSSVYPAKLASCTYAYDGGDGDTLLPLSAEMQLNMKIGTVMVDTLQASGTVLVSERFESRKESVSLSYENVLCGEELPTGDEICALCGVLRYYGYDAEKTDLCDLYLEKGPVGFTDFATANVGNPRNRYNSYGCFASVIVSAANRYLAVEGGREAVSLCGYNPDALFLEVSDGNPVLVWVSEDLTKPFTVTDSWEVDGKTVYLRSGMACMVLIGYDTDRRTVTLADPDGSVFQADLSLFLARYREMGAQAVVLRSCVL